MLFVVRRVYHIDMTVSRQVHGNTRAAGTGARARMKKRMLDTAMRLMEEGLIPSVSEVAEAAEVSRATAYRYFPSQAAMIQETVAQALGPILEWESDSTEAEERIADLIDFAYPHIETYEATHRAVLMLAIDQWTRGKAGTLGNEARLVRGNRKGLLNAALKPLKNRLSPAEFDRLTQALSLVFGTEALVVLKDVSGLDGEEARRVAIWASLALVRSAIADSGAVERSRRQSGMKTKSGMKTARKRTGRTVN